MIVISARLFGIPFPTWKIRIGVDIPVAHYKANFGVLSLEITTLPKDAPAPTHAQELQPTSTPNAHDAPHPDLRV